MKLAVFTVMLPDLNKEQTLAALKKYGYDGVEWRVKTTDPMTHHEAPSFWGNNLSTVSTDSTDDELDSLKKGADQVGLVVPNLATYLSCGDLEAVERGMRIAKRLGAPSLRIGVPEYNRTKSYSELFAEAKIYLHHVEELSKHYGIKGMIETHMFRISASASAAFLLVNGFDPDYIGVIYDPGNMVQEGYEQYRMGLELLGPYLGHVHVKNAIWKLSDATNPQNFNWEVEWCRIDRGIVSWDQVINDLKAIGYDNWLSFEDFSQSGTSEELLKRNLNYIKSLL